MPLMSQEVYDALLDIGVSDSKARNVATVLATPLQLERDIASIRNDISSIRSDQSTIRNDISSIKGELSVLKWAIGINSTLVILVLGKLLFFMK